MASHVRFSKLSCRKKVIIWVRYVDLQTWRPAYNTDTHTSFRKCSFHKWLPYLNEAILRNCLDSHLASLENVLTSLTGPASLAHPRSSASQPGISSQNSRSVDLLFIPVAVVYNLRLSSWLGSRVVDASCQSYSRSPPA